MFTSYCSSRATVSLLSVSTILTPINAVLIVCGQAASIKHVKHEMVVEARERVNYVILLEEFLHPLDHKLQSYPFLIVQQDVDNLISFKCI